MPSASISFFNFYWPHGPDVPAFRFQGPERRFGNSRVSNEARELLRQKGHGDIFSSRAIYVSYDKSVETFSDALGRLSGRFDEVGLAYIPPTEAMWHQESWVRIFPYASVEGIKFRLLEVPKETAPSGSSKDAWLLEEGINGISVPSRIRQSEGRHYLLMALVERPRFPKQISREQADDFIRRFRECGLRFQPDLSFKADEIDRNLLVLGGRLCYLDAGDLLWGRVGSAQEPHQIESVRSALSRRIENVEAHDRGCGAVKGLVF